jgi:tryptophan synthase alpha chain
MSRIKGAFKSTKKPLIIAFTVAGDPDPERSASIAKTIVSSGADILEFGVPFSDPLADGPVIQRADVRALRAGTNPGTVFGIVREVRKVSDLPIVLLTYYNSVYRRGLEKFYRDAAQAGVDGILIADMPVEESDDAVSAAKTAGIDPIFMISETTSEDRLVKILDRAGGFLYLVSRLGVTGARKDLSPGIVSLISRVRSRTKMPIAVGFGISSPEHVRVLSKAGADAAIVGSAIVACIEEHIGTVPEMEDALREYISSMRNATLIQPDT